MGSLGIPGAHPELRHGEPDLEGAFNDDYELSPERAGTALWRWAVIAWSVAAWCIGSFVMVESIFSGISRLWR